MPSIVQFLHSGVEHKPDNPPTNDYKNWNVGDHRRKFLTCSGDYIERNNLQTGELFFWNEWEPQSSVTLLAQQGNQLLPKWLHKRDLLYPIPNGPGLQNTDPFIFDNEFKYFVCLQMRKHSNVWRSMALARLEVGSLILFGSKGTWKAKSVFQLDTVFVISDFTNYNPSRNPLTISQIGQTYNNYVYSKLFSGFYPNVDLRLYYGATFDNKLSDMYSFVPSQVPNREGHAGFARVALGDSTYINTKKTQGYKITHHLTINQIRSFWREVVRKSRSSQCVEGVRFY